MGRATRLMCQCRNLSTSADVSRQELAKFKILDTNSHHLFAMARTQRLEKELTWKRSHLAEVLSS